MTTIVRVNHDQTYQIIGWDLANFNSNNTLIIGSIDLAEVTNVFKDIESLEVIRDGNIIASFTMYNTYDGIAYGGARYNPETGSFGEVLEIHLTKANLIEQVERLDQQLNPNVDITTLSFADLKEYKLKEVSSACEADIYDGMVIEIEPGVTQKFSFTLQDQNNWSELMMLALIAPDMNSFPQHADYGDCQFFTRQQVMLIESSLLLRKVQITTYCNQLNQYIRSLGINDRKTLEAVTYGMTLPQSYMDKINEIVSVTIEEMSSFIHIITPDSESEDDDIVDPSGSEDGSDEPNNGSDEPDNNEEPEESGNNE